MTAPTTTKTTKTTRKAALSEKAMLADLHIGFWEGRYKDKSTTAEVIKQKDADSDAGAWWTRIIPASATSRMASAVTKGRKLHWDYTMPWNDAGQRVLPAANFLEYTAALREVKAEFEAAADEFMAAYPTIITNAANRLGGLNDIEFPTAKAVRRKYYWQTVIAPFPDAADFRVDVGDAQVEEIRADIEQQTKDTLAHSMGDLWSRLHKAMSALVEGLSADGTLTSNRVQKVKDICDLLPKMNITGDADLEAMRSEIVTKLADLQPEDLRKDRKARATSHQTAADILKKMGAFMPAPQE